MKKLIALLTLTALTVMTLGPALTVATADVTADLTKGTGGSLIPIIKAKWEMKTGTSPLGKDDSSDAGAQFLAPGVWESTMKNTVCTIAANPPGAPAIQGVYAEIFYPLSANRPAIHEDPAYPDVHPDTQGGTQDEGLGGCGAFIEQNTLIKLDKTPGYQLFCNDIRNSNINLPTFYSGYTYAEICAADGELMKEEAYVYCDSKTLTWEDPAGLYKVRTYAQNQAGTSNYLQNDFEYLPLTGFAKDFTNVNYGEISQMNVHKKISGDLTFSTANKPTIRNIGNTRLWMKVAQDDMGFGVRDITNWNVEFDARVGNHEADWTVYDPFGFKGSTPTSGQYIPLEDILDLSEIEEMDFSVSVEKWLEPTSYNGGIWLSAKDAPFRICN